MGSQLLWRCASEWELHAPQAATQRATALEYALVERSQEAVQLRRSLHAARQAADPNIVQVWWFLVQSPAVWIC